MTLSFTPRRAIALGLAAAMSLLLAACFVLPGKFDAKLDLRKDGRFSYSYKGQIFVLGLSKLADIADKADAAEQKFEASACYDDKTDQERDCTAQEIANQKSDWEEEQKTRASKKQQDKDLTKTMLGGIDPNDPKAGEEMATRLRRQAGFTSVIYKGDGLYEVDFSVTGRIDHDFAFPTIERMPSIIPFLVINRRADGSVRVDSPIFEDSDSKGQMGGLAKAIAADKGNESGSTAGMPVIEGTLTLTTDGTILANNTDEGPQADPTGKKLSWKINPRNSLAPMALIQLGK